MEKWSSERALVLHVIGCFKGTSISEVLTWQLHVSFVSAKLAQFIPAETILAQYMTTHV